MEQQKTVVALLREYAAKTEFGIGGKAFWEIVVQSLFLQRTPLMAAPLLDKGNLKMEKALDCSRA